MITLKWHGDLPDRDIDQLELVVLKDLKQNLTSLGNPSDLICHVVTLTNDYDGPTVYVWGEPGDNNHFHCEYTDKAEWVTLTGEDTNV